MIDDFLYNNPDLYEKVFPARGKSDLCVKVLQELSVNASQSILDVGCGTGRDLAGMSSHFLTCVGFDINPAMIAFARQRYPRLEFHTGDMRTHRLGRTFDVICAMGGCINFALSDDDLEATVETFQAHAHPGTLLFLQPMNPVDYFCQLKVPTTFSVPLGDSVATAIAKYEFDTQAQIVRRERTWAIDGVSAQYTDSMSYRILTSGELKYLLRLSGFEVLRIFEGVGSAAYANKSMYLVAKYNR